MRRDKHAGRFCWRVSGFVPFDFQAFLPVDRKSRPMGVASVRSRGRPCILARIARGKLVMGPNTPADAM